MNHVLCLRPWRPSLSVISAAFIAFGRSCLLAKTRRRASRSSSSLSIRCNSSRASETRSRSLESTTKMIPCVFWKSERSNSESIASGQSMSHVQCLQRGRILSCPPTSQTVNEMFLYSTVSTLKPMIEVNSEICNVVGVEGTDRRLTNCRNGGDDLTEFEFV